MFDNLFSPIAINKLEIKNRIVYPSLGLLYTLDNKINDKYFNFYVERAKGGAGIITVGPVGFDDYGVGIAAPLLNSDEAVPSFAKLAGAIKKAGARAWVQLFHAGAYAYSMQIGGRQAIAPSSVYSKYTKETPRELTIDDIKELQKKIILAAERAMQAGFDGVEIIASAGYLITQFLSPLKNQRTDEFGGSFENRVRFPREIIEMMREKLGPDYPITIRMAGNDFVPGSNTALETQKFAQVYEKAGVDAINVTGGWHESRVPQLSMELPRGGFSYLAMNIKQAVSVPVMASNRITDPYMADQIIKDDIADFVNLGRVLIADPYWPQKALAGRTDEIRPCIACSQGCTDELFSGRPVSCIVNAAVGYESERVIKKTKKSKKIMVVGGGPGGLEAAYRAAEAGHHVELYEKRDDIGGQLWIAGTPPHKQELWEIIRYYDAMIEKFDINVFLETEVDINLIKEKKPDHVIIAEGAEPAKPPIDGIDDPRVISAWDLLENDPKIGKRVAIIGGGAVGVETAHFLAVKGTIEPEVLHFLMKYEAEPVDRLHNLILFGSKDITIFEMLPKFGSGVGRSTKWIILGNIDRYGVKKVPAAKVLSVKNGAVIYEQGGEQKRLECDTIVNAVGSRSVRKLSEKIKDTGIPFSLIGDCVRPAQINTAIHEAFLAVMDLE